MQAVRRFLRRFIPPLVVFLLRALASTLRWRVEDRHGITRPGVNPPFIAVFWHNRILTMPLLYHRFCRWRQGYCLTSPSKDGAIVAAVMAHFHVGSVRGSSSRRGSTALREMTAVLESGGDIGISPDGPRGPKYQLHPGAIKLAQLTGAPLMPLHVAYSRYWELKSWDAFRIPKPFARVSVLIDEPIFLPRELDPAAFEAARAEVETVLLQGIEAAEKNLS